MGLQELKIADKDETLGKVYDVLVNTCGASESSRESFLIMQSAANYPREWRFEGHLGYGGKLWRIRNTPPYVTCYPEDETPHRKAIMDQANQALKALSLP